MRSIMLCLGSFALITLASQSAIAQSGGGLPTTPTANPFAPPQLPSGFQPENTPAPKPFMLPDPTRRERSQPVPTTINDTSAPHPWTVRPNNGAWMICVRSYSGTDSLKLAEQLTREIRENHKVAAYLYSRNLEELKRERAQIEAIRKAEAAKNEPFLRAAAEARKQAKANGEEFIDSSITIKVPKPYHETPEQWAVLIGGFPDADAARKALDVVRQLPPPKDVMLMDPIIFEKRVDGKMVAEGTYLNPFKTAMVVMNPIRKEVKEGDVPKIEPFIVKINEGEEHSLLKSKKAWTLQVKSFTVPMRVVSEKTDDSVFQKAINAISGKKSFLDLTAEQAQELVNALRDPKMKEGPFDAMILHHRTGSLVCVGQYDTPNDPELIRVQKILQSITFKIERKDNGTTEMQKMFGTVSPMPIPKY